MQRSVHGLLPQPLYLSGLSARLGAERLGAQAAVADGRYAEAQWAKDGYLGVRRSSQPVPAMALGVAQAALDCARVDGTQLRAISFTAIHDHGHRRLWQPAAYLQDQLQARAALSWSVTHGCNGLAIALVQAGLMMPALAGPMLVVGADRFEGGAFDRWRSDTGLVYGDGACAAVLDPDAGFARIVYADVDYLSELEGMHRLDEVEADRAREWNITESKQAFMRRHGAGKFFDVLGAGLARLKERLTAALDAQGIVARAVVTPFVGRSVSDTTYARHFHPLGAINTAGFGAQLGHTGTADQLLGLAHLLSSGQLAAGDAVILIGAGAGFSLSAMVVRVLRLPDVDTLGEFA